MKVLHSMLVSPMVCLLRITFLEQNDLGTEVPWKPAWFIQTYRWEVVCLLQTHKKKLTIPKEVSCPNPGEVNWQLVLDVPRYLPNSPDGTTCLFQSTSSAEPLCLRVCLPQPLADRFVCPCLQLATWKPAPEQSLRGPVPRAELCSCQDMTACQKRRRSPSRAQALL